MQTQNVYVSDASSKSRMAAVLLCLLFGVLGFHRFYVGKVGTGVIWLLTGGVFGVGWLIDSVMTIVGSFRDANGRFVSTWFN